MPHTGILCYEWYNQTSGNCPGPAITALVKAQRDSRLQTQVFPTKSQNYAPKGAEATLLQKQRILLSLWKKIINYFNIKLNGKMSKIHKFHSLPQKVVNQHA